MISKNQSVIKLSPADNVAIAIETIRQGATVDMADMKLTVRQPIKMGHKLALTDIKQGDEVVKYGQVIGFASQPILMGSHVHTHNQAAELFERDYAFCSACPVPKPIPKVQRTFEGYDQGDGRY